MCLIYDYRFGLTQTPPLERHREAQANTHAHTHAHTPQENKDTNRNGRREAVQGSIMVQGKVGEAAFPEPWFRRSSLGGLGESNSRGVRGSGQPFGGTAPLVLSGRPFFSALP